jgi:hypothetical protein
MHPIGRSSSRQFTRRRGRSATAVSELTDGFQPADRPLSVRCLDRRSDTLGRSGGASIYEDPRRPWRKQAKKLSPFRFSPCAPCGAAMPVPTWSGRCLRPITPKKLHVWRTRERNSDCPIRSTRCPRCIARSAPEAPRIFLIQSRISFAISSRRTTSPSSISTPIANSGPSPSSSRSW